MSVPPDPAPAVLTKPDTQPDRLVARARPLFLYVMYSMVLWALPIGIVGAARPDVAANMTRAIAAYLAAIPESLWAVFATGYLGYTAARSWGKAKGSEH